MAKQSGKAGTAAKNTGEEKNTAVKPAQSAQSAQSAQPQQSQQPPQTAPSQETAPAAPVKRGRGRPRKGESAGSSAPSKKSAAKAKELIPQPEDKIFALDIGTRTVVGIIGHMDDGIFCIDYAESIPHKRRAMIDGQIEDIPLVAAAVKRITEKLEAKSGFKLSRVGIAAAGRALKTRRTEMSFDIKDKESITEDDVKSFELETTLKAQDELDSEISEAGMMFYCVGHTVVQYLLDDYRIGSLVGHKGKKVCVELIAAFLPSPVVESLYAVTDMNGLEVDSLTLEPIAAMNIVIPPEIRLINVALVDIGAGTSDIAIARGGSIVAYAMSTTAGDEITEEIIKKYLVDFSTAEEMKLSSYKPKIEYSDILGFTHTIDTEEFFKSLFNAVDQLSDDIAKNIIAANGEAPAAVFLVGGGSLIPDLAKYVAEKLNIPENRVAVGRNEVMKNVDFGTSGVSGPEFVTPLGIGVTATMNSGYDFSVVTLNDKKMRVFDTRAVRVLDLLTAAGYRSNQIIGRSGRNLNFTLNGEKRFLKGELATAAEVTINGEQASLETIVNQGDRLEFKPAVSGKNAEVRVADIAGDVSPRSLTIDGTEYFFGIIACVNEKQVSSEYQVQNLDSVEVSEIETLGDLMQVLPFDTTKIDFYKAGKKLTIDYYLKDGDDLVTSDKPEEHVNFESLARAAAEKEAAEKLAAHNKFLEETADDFVVHNTETNKAEDAASADTQTEEEPEEYVEFKVNLNGKTITLPDAPMHEFIELMAIVDIDLDNPPADANMILTLNGKDANFMDPLKNGDTVVIRWAT